MFSESLRVTVSNHIPAFKSRKMFYQKGKKQKHTAVIIPETAENCVGRPVHVQNIYLPAGTGRLYKHSYDINFFQTRDKSIHCLTLTLMNSLSNCCVDKNFTGNWLAPSQMPATVVRNTSFTSQEKGICKVNYFLTLKAPGIPETWYAVSPHHNLHTKFCHFLWMWELMEELCDM